MSPSVLCEQYISYLGRDIQPPLLHRGGASLNFERGVEEGGKGRGDRETN